MLRTRKQRTIFVFTIIGIIVLMLQYLPYKYLYLDSIEPEPYGKCILTIPNDPACKDGGSNSVYVLRDGNTTMLTKIDGVNSCEEYMNSTPVRDSFHGTVAPLVSVAVLIADCIGIIWAFVFFIASGIKSLWKWFFD